MLDRPAGTRRGANMFSAKNVSFTDGVQGREENHASPEEEEAREIEKIKADCESISCRRGVFFDQIDREHLEFPTRVYTERQDLDRNLQFAERFSERERSRHEFTEFDFDAAFARYLKIVNLFDMAIRESFLDEGNR
ncbi:MAG: hypothetical protein AAGJ87_14070, partial [Pseudomonadota bacterium]